MTELPTDQDILERLEEYRYYGPDEGVEEVCNEASKKITALRDYGRKQREQVQAHWRGINKLKRENKRLQTALKNIQREADFDSQSDPGWWALDALTHVWALAHDALGGTRE